MAKTTRTHFREGLIGAIVTVLCSCQVEPSPEIRDGRVGRPTAVASEDARHELQELTHDLAVALGDQSIRARLLAAFRGSRHREGKVDAEHLVLQRENGIGAAMAARTGRGESEIVSRIRSLGRLEIYLPVRAHREAWDGTSDVVVATSLTEDEVPIGFDVNGQPVPLSLDAPPSRAVIVIVPAESSLEDVEPRATPSGGPQLATCGEECLPPCSGDTCGGTGGDGSSGGETSSGGYTAFTPGIYMNYLHLSDLHEPWTRGDPEIEVMLIGPTDQTGLDGVALAGLAANEERSAPRMFNMNENTWEQGGNGVLIASKVDIDKIMSQYPPAPFPDSLRAFSLTVWEDDYRLGAIYDPASKYNAAIGASGLLLSGVYLKVFQGNLWGTVLASVAFWMLTDTNIGWDAFGAEDDFAGTMIDGLKWLEATGQVTEHSHAIVLGNHRDGTATLTYRMTSQ